ncbi:receptor-like protein EIX2 [Pyrus x bretschneideri]|uniref:receptor-like protein EIX2 n=1 Tax=Pyrus x bretschneideri TaxID=225117 RepID=UPI00202F9E66|nr:receptor-like protein EIX2 [Pyrus x bretschneideri]
MKILMHCKSLYTLLIGGSFDCKAISTDDDMVDFHGFQNLRVLTLDNCGLTGQIPGSIDLGGNNISGSIPTEIGQLQLFQQLYLDSNNFSDEVPDQISSLKYLEILNLSTNHLIGKIPSSTTNLSFLSTFDVSYNNLEGRIPIGMHQSFDTSAFKGNPKLCGAPLPNECREIDVDNKNNINQDEDNKYDELPWFCISAALGYIVGFWGVCGSLVLKKTWRHAYFRFLNNTLK